MHKAQQHRAYTEYGVPLVDEELASLEKTMFELCNAAMPEYQYPGKIKDSESLQILGEVVLQSHWYDPRVWFELFTGKTASYNPIVHGETRERNWFQLASGLKTSKDIPAVTSPALAKRMKTYFLWRDLSFGDVGRWPEKAYRFGYTSPPITFGTNRTIDSTRLAGMQVGAAKARITGIDRGGRTLALDLWGICNQDIRTVGAEVDLVQHLRSSARWVAKS